ncbi:sulfotransferase [Micromonospora sp. CPCC 205539]|uniref:sulfotransferase n=1 Tax=Micromonospora sp. CPCC 205539 TaxID=3122408 RepID=UPI002FEEA734
MKVLYLTGWCRSGSTVLGNLLGELPEVVHVGELYYLWRNGVLGIGTNTSCGCGEPLTRCPLWSVVVDRVAGRSPAQAAQRIIAEQQRHVRVRHTGARLAEVTGRRPRPAGVTEVARRMLATYRAVAEETGAEVIVDGSKYPAEAAVLLGDAGLDLRVLHLVRDPRAVAHSFARPKQYLPQMGAARSTGMWTAINVASDRVGRAAPERYLRLRYEDFAAAPRDVLSRVLRWADLPGEPPVGADGRAVLGVNHTVTGNPDRLRQGPTTIRPDLAWRDALPARTAAVATTLAAPVLHRYGYPIRP